MMINTVPMIENDEKKFSHVRDVPLNKIRVTENVRKANISKSISDPTLGASDFSSEEHEEILNLSASINSYGLLHPIIIDEDMNLVAGFRRLMACRELGWKEITCVISNRGKETDRIVRLIENTSRKDLSVYEKASALKDLAERHGISSRLELSSMVGKSQKWVDTMLSIFDPRTDESVRDGVKNGHVGSGAVGELARLDKGQQCEIIESIKSKGRRISKSTVKKEIRDLRLKKKTEQLSMGFLSHEDVKNNVVDSFMEQSGINDDETLLLVRRFFDYLVDKKMVILK